MNAYSQFCIKNCPIGKEESEKLLRENNSAFDAVFDMKLFINQCINNCKYKKDREEFNKIGLNSLIDN